MFDFYFTKYILTLNKGLIHHFFLNKEMSLMEIGGGVSTYLHEREREPLSITIK